MAFADITSHKDFKKNPCEKFYNCKSGVFSYYDREKGENVPVENLNLLVLTDFPSVWQGYDDGKKVMIQTHTIYDWSKPMSLWYWNDGKRVEIAKGIYRKNPNNSDEELFKLKVKEKCKLHKVVFGIDLGTTEMVQIIFPMGQLKPIQEAKPDWEKQSILFTGQKTAKDEKLGNEWEIPTFELKPLTQDQIAFAKAKAAVLIEFIESQKSIRIEDRDDDGQESDAPQPRIVEGDKKPENKAQNIPDIKYESDVDPKDLPW